MIYDSPTNSILPIDDDICSRLLYDLGQNQHFVDQKLLQV